MDTDSDTWLEDTINANFKQLHHLEDVIYEGWTGFQNVIRQNLRQFQVDCPRCKAA